jgi:RNA polymerase-binding transcription factor DksA
MKNAQHTKEELIKRRDEINNQLNRTESDLRIELERDPEEQAIQVEHDEVAIAMENNLRTELNEIEEKLAQIEDNQ